MIDKKQAHYPIPYLRVLAILLVLTCSLAVIFPAFTTHAQEETPPPPVRTLRVLSHNTNAFPEISLDLLAQEDNHAIAGLTADKFALDEPYENLQVEPTYHQATATVIIVDLSSGSDDDLIRETLLAYLTESYQEGDSLAFYIVAGENPSFQEVANRTQAESLINTLFSIGNTGYGIAPALEAALGYLQVQEQTNPNLNSQAIVVGSYLYVTRIAEAATLFKEAHIPLHVIQAHRLRQPSTPDMQRLAETGGGIFVDNQNGQYLFQQSANAFAAIGALADLFTAFNDNRLAYHLSYRTQSQSLSTVRTIQVTAALSDGSQLSGSFDYEPKFAHPEVTIIAPTNLNPTRTVGTNGIFDKSEETIVARVDFPDMPRNITRIRLEVFNQTTGEVVQAPLEIITIEQDDDGNLLIPWSLEAYSVFGESYPVTLKLTVIDELGLFDTITQNANVVVAVPIVQATATSLPTYTPLPTFTTAPTYTPLPTFTPQLTLTNAPTYTPFPTFTPVPAVVLPASTLAPETDSSDKPAELVEGFDRLAAIILGILVINLIGIILFLRRAGAGQRLAAQGASVVRTAIYRAKTSVFKNKSGDNPDTSQDKVIAKLLVLRGLEGIEFISIDRVRFIIGRETAAGCNYAIPFPHVSSQHLSIFYKNDVFTIMDMDTANGTYLNGHKLIPNREYPLQDAARILVVNDIEFEFQPLVQQQEITQRYIPPSTQDLPEKPVSSEAAKEEPSTSSEIRRAGGLRTRLSEMLAQSDGATENKSADRQALNWQSLPPKGSEDSDTDKKLSHHWDPFESDD